MPDEKLEKPKETCGLMLVFKGGVSTQVNLSVKKGEVISKIQDFISAGIQGLVQFNTANPNEEEICLFDPKEILVVMVKKEFIMTSGRIVQPGPNVNPERFKH